MSFTENERNFYSLLEEYDPYSDDFDVLTRNPIFRVTRWLAWLEAMSASLPKNKTLREKNQKSYRYLITFTMAPSKLKKDVDKEVQFSKMENYIKSLATSKQYDATHWAVVRELTKAGNPHWHVSVISNTWIKKDYFRYYERMYGTVDVDKSRKPQKEYALNYMEKEDDYTTIL